MSPLLYLLTSRSLSSGMDPRSIVTFWFRCLGSHQGKARGVPLHDRRLADLEAQWDCWSWGPEGE